MKKEKNPEYNYFEEILSLWSKCLVLWHLQQIINVIFSKDIIISNEVFSWLTIMSIVNINIISTISPVFIEYLINPYFQLT